MRDGDRSYHGLVGQTFAERAAAPGLNSLHERPAVLALIGDVAGKRITDLGCGAGHLALELTGRGAEVIGVEGSDSLVAHARELLGPSVKVFHHNLEKHLDFIPEGSQDGVVCSLVLHHLDDRLRFLQEVRRILRPGGWFVVSSTHPTADWGRFGGSYFDERWIQRPVAPEQLIEYRTMPMSVLVNELLDTGFTLARMVEPQPDPALRAVEPEKFDALSEAPVFIVLRLRAPGLL